jgi:hypothetical protein
MIPRMLRRVRQAAGKLGKRFIEQAEQTAREIHDTADGKGNPSQEAREWARWATKRYKIPRTPEQG